MGSQVILRVLFYFNLSKFLMGHLLIKLRRLSRNSYRPFLNNL